jgi:hypothetical protein
MPSSTYSTERSPFVPQPLLSRTASEVSSLSLTYYLHPLLTLP